MRNVDDRCVMSCCMNWLLMCILNICKDVLDCLHKVVGIDVVEIAFWAKVHCNKSKCPRRNLRHFSVFLFPRLSYFMNFVCLSEELSYCGIYQVRPHIWLILRMFVLLMDLNINLLMYVDPLKENTPTITKQRLNVEGRPVEAAVTEGDMKVMVERELVSQAEEEDMEALLGT